MKIIIYSSISVFCFVVAICCLDQIRKNEKRIETINLEVNRLRDSLDLTIKTQDVIIKTVGVHQEIIETLLEKKNVIKL